MFTFITTLFVKLFTHIQTVSRENRDDRELKHNKETHFHEQTTNKEVFKQSNAHLLLAERTVIAN